MTTQITITEALAEIKTIGKRIEKKHEFVLSYIARQDAAKDPFEKDGGIEAVLAREIQAISDLETRLIALRRGIQRENDQTMVAINGMSRTISEWLTWRRDVAPLQRKFLNSIRATINQLREEAKRKGFAVVSGDRSLTSEVQPQDLIVHVDERKCAAESEALEDTLGQLDGQLSLKNATVLIAA